MDVDEVLLTGLERFEGVLEKVGPHDWDRPSPCAAWDVRALTGHVLTVVESAATLLGGSSFDWSMAAEPSEVAGDDPLGTFRHWAALATGALPLADLDVVTETPMGPMAVRTRLSFPAMDLHLHAWDLGRAIGVRVEIPEEVGTFAHDAIDPLPAEMVRSEGVFGPQVPAPADASPTEALMAWTGRQPR